MNEKNVKNDFFFLICIKIYYKLKYFYKISLVLSIYNIFNKSKKNKIFNICIFSFFQKKNDFICFKFLLIFLSIKNFDIQNR